MGPFISFNNNNRYIIALDNRKSALPKPKPCYLFIVKKVCCHHFRFWICFTLLRTQFPVTMINCPAVCYFSYIIYVFKSKNFGRNFKKSATFKKLNFVVIKLVFRTQFCTCNLTGGANIVDELSQIKSLKEKKEDWESSVAEASSEKRPGIQLEEFEAGRVKDNLDK